MTSSAYMHDHSASKQNVCTQKMSFTWLYAACSPNLRQIRHRINTPVWKISVKLKRALILNRGNDVKQVYAHAHRWRKTKHSWLLRGSVNSTNWDVNDWFRAVRGDTCRDTERHFITTRVQNCAQQSTRTAAARYESSMYGLLANVTFIRLHVLQLGVVHKAWTWEQIVILRFCSSLPVCFLATFCGLRTVGNLWRNFRSDVRSVEKRSGG